MSVCLAVGNALTIGKIPIASERDIKNRIVSAIHGTVCVVLTAYNIFSAGAELDALNTNF